jgi:putative hydrolase of the HAD superfamily
VDDTLYDFSAGILAGLTAITGLYESLARPTPEELFASYKRILYEIHPLVFKGVFTLKESRRERLRRLFGELGEEISPQALAEVESAFNQAYDTVFLPVAGAHALLEQLTGKVAIGVLSNNVRDGVEKLLRRLDLDRFVDACFTADMVGVTKPDPAMFRQALDHFEVDAVEAVMIGDSWANDVLGAAALGIRPVWFNRSGQPCPDPALAEQLTTLEPAELAMKIILTDGHLSGQGPSGA